MSCNLTDGEMEHLQAVFVTRQKEKKKMPYEKDPSEIGALWKKEGKKGPYLSGLINGQSVVAFPNTNKKSDNQPDYRVLVPRREKREVSSDEDIPF